MRSVAGNDDIADFDSSYVFAHTLDDTSSLVAEDAGEAALGIAAVQSVDIGMAQSVRDNFDSDLAFSGGSHPHFLDLHGLLGGVSNSGPALN